MGSDFNDEVNMILGLWDKFHDSFDHHIHPPPALTAMLFAIVKEQIANAMVVVNDPDISDTERIQIAMANLCDLTMRFGVYLKEHNFDIDTELTQCDCFILTNKDVENLLKGE